MTMIDYRIEDIEITVNGANYWANGSVHVDTVDVARSASVGEPGGVEVTGYGRMDVVLTSVEDGSESADLILHAGNPIFDAIIAQVANHIDETVN
jgi:hypothetical protein